MYNGLMYFHYSHLCIILWYIPDVIIFVGIIKMSNKRPSEKTIRMF